MKITTPHFIKSGKTGNSLQTVNYLFKVFAIFCKLDFYKFQNPPAWH